MKLPSFSCTFAAIIALATFGSIGTANAADPAATKAPPSAAYTASLTKTFNPWTFDIGLGLGGQSIGVNETDAPKGTVLIGGAFGNVTYNFDKIWGIRAGVAANILGSTSKTYVDTWGGGWTETTKVKYESGPSVDLKLGPVVNVTDNLQLGLAGLMRIGTQKVSIDDTLSNGVLSATNSGSVSQTKVRAGLEGTLRYQRIAGTGIFAESYANWVSGSKVNGTAFGNPVSFKTKDEVGAGFRIGYTF